MAHVHRDAIPWAPYTARELAGHGPRPTPAPSLNQRQWGRGSGRGGWGRGDGEWSSYSGWWGWVSDGQTSTSHPATTAPKPTASSSSVHAPESPPTSDVSQSPSSPNQPDPVQTSDTASNPDTRPTGTSGNGSDTTRTTDAGESDSTPAETGSKPSAQSQTSREVQLLPSGGPKSDSDEAVSSQPTPPPAANQDVQTTGRGGLSARMIALIVTSVLLFLLLLALFLFFWRRRRRRSGNRTLLGRNQQRESVTPRPFMHLTETTATADAGVERRVSDMTMVGGAPYNLVTCVADNKHGSRGWPALAPVQASDVGATAGEERTDDAIGTPSPVISSEGPHNAQQTQMSSPTDGTWEGGPFRSTEGQITSRDSNAHTLGHSTRFSDSTRADPTARFSQATGTTLFSSSPANRDRELEELHTAMTQAGLNVQTLLSSLQARPMEPHERDAHPPEYGA